MRPNARVRPPVCLSVCLPVCLPVDNFLLWGSTKLITMRLLITLLSLSALANAQFGGFFDHMFGGGGGGHGHDQQQQSRNNPSDAGHYRQRFDQCM